MEFKNLPEINFAVKPVEEIESSVVALYESMTGRNLTRSDPVMLFLKTVAALLVQMRVLINETGKQNLLAFATDGNLEHIGVLVGAERLQATAARTTLRVTLSVPRAQSTIIPAGTRATAGDEVLFSIAETTVIPAGNLFVDTVALCTQTGTIGNDYLPGEIKKIVDPLPFVASIVNTTKSEGGSNTEQNTPYRERIRQAPESFSCAGPDGAYKYHAMRASALIVDVSVGSARPGEVEIRPLLRGGEIPGNEILKAVEDILSDRKVRPLTDQLIVLVPECVNYDIDLTYWINAENATSMVSIQAAIEQAVADFELWQKSRLGRNINPSELIYRICAAGAKRVDIRSPVFKTTTKAQVAITQNKSIIFGGLEDE